MSCSLSISPAYQQPVLEGVALQALFGIVSGMIPDGGDCQHVGEAALVAFWGGATFLMWRHPRNPTKTELGFVRIGYAAVFILVFALFRVECFVKGLM